MQLIDYMKYIDLACRIAFVPRYRWIGGPRDRDKQTTVKQSFFLFGVAFMVYQNFGVNMYWFLFGRNEKDMDKFVTQLSETCGSLMLVTAACSFVWTLTRNRSNIEAVFAELQALSYRPEDNQDRCQHYHEMAIFIMEIMFKFYIIFYVYYNTAPLLLLMWENLMDKDISYKMQANMWFPWKIQGSALGFGIGVISQAMGSIVGVGFTIKVLCLNCIFTWQIKLHCDALSCQLLSLNSSSPESHWKLRSLIAYHWRILEIGEQCNRILNPIFLTSQIFSAIAICTTSVAVLLLDLASAIKYVSGLVAFVLYYFFICYMGTEVTRAIMS
ncbi:putative odorant receptor 69a [Drosophila rhopaloa]|uniref:Odorant receptor 69a n=1 Tax=Drosophila rhopaloa TaxID=1041015 RepID=A0ABM5J4B1_DRORH|nr:putative odorant receptor 69a [Drosophila rhopaloa]